MSGQIDEAEVTRLRIERDTLLDKAARLMVAYHVAICSPKGVVPIDEFYDPVLAVDIQQRLDAALEKNP